MPQLDLLTYPDIVNLVAYLFPFLSALLAIRVSKYRNLRGRVVRLMSSLLSKE